ncbi:MAG TPA: serine hydrolase [Caulobacteraceae bacterium]|nr:serine hydrolase [Caulobacteraceae bacterium]
MFRMMIAVVAAAAMMAAGAAPAQALAPKPAKAWTIPERPEIRKILVQRIDEQRQGRAIVVGVVDASGSRVVSYGVRDDGDNRPLDGRSMFEIGSMSKVFTSLLLADMAERSEVRLDDPVARYLPPGTKVPERNGKQITLIDLATHTSGLPRIPSNMAPKDPANPYADYTAEQLYQFLATYELPRDIGSKYEYSNLGGGLLGFALSRRTGMSYEALLKQRITGPLNMRSTSITLTADQRKRLEQGYDASLHPVANWDFQDVTAGAGAIRSDADDLLAFLDAELGLNPSPLSAAMQAQLKPRRPTDIPNTEVALGWHITRVADRTIVWHNGGTGGYRSMMAFDPEARAGVVVLSDAETPAGVDDIAFHILVGTPLAPPPPPMPAPVEHHEITVGRATLQGLVGRYQLAPEIFVDVTQKDGQLYVQLTGQQSLPVFFEGPHRVFWKVAPATADFEVDPQGKASAMVVHQGGRDLRAERVPAP